MIHDPWRSRAVLALFLGLLLLPASAAADATEDREKAAAYDEQAARLYEQGRWEAARKEWEAAYALDPEPRFLLSIGYTYRQNNLTDEAVDYFLRYLHEMDEAEARDGRRRIDPTVKVDLERYIGQIRSAKERLGVGRPGPGPGSGPGPEPSGREPAPYLAAEELVDAEELFAQMVKEHKAGNTAVANDLGKRLEEAARLRGDPVLSYYFGRAYEQMGKKKEALAAYRRFLAGDYGEPQMRKEAAARVAVLTPPPPGQKYLWPGLVFAALGLAGAGVGTYFYLEAQRNFERFQEPISEQEKRDLRGRSDLLGLGTIVSFAAGGGFVLGAAVFLGVAFKKGVRHQKAERVALFPEALPARPPSLLSGLPPLRAGIMPIPGGGGLLLQGSF